MKKCIVIIFIGLSLINNAQDGNVKFQENISFDKALQKARAEDKLIFLDFYTDWCGPCKLMDKNVFSKKQVGDFYNENFINLKINAEKGEGVILRKKFDVNVYPTMLFVNLDNEIVLNKVGAKDINEALSIGKIALNSTANLKTITREVKKGNRSGKYVWLYLNANLKRKYWDDKKAVKLLNEYYSLISDEEKFSYYSWDLFNIFIFDIYNPQYKFFLDNKHQYELLYGKIAVDEKVCYTMVYNYNKYKNDSLKFNDFKELDPKIFKGVNWQTNQLITTLKYEKDTNSILKWHEFVKGVEGYEAWLEFEVTILPLDIILNNVSMLVLNNYRQFQDTTALKLAKKWSKKSMDMNPQEHYFIDTYAHILFELNDIKGAIKYQEIAFKLANKEQDESSEFYQKELLRFKSRL